MIIWTCDQIKSALGQQLIKPPANSSFKVSQVVIDSRKKTNNSLFIAIAGENNDGHNFLNQAFEDFLFCISFFHSILLPEFLASFILIVAFCFEPIK